MTFFPDPVFGWLFCLTLAGLTLAAAWRDWKTMTVPKPLVFAMLGTGLAFNLIRGGWLGLESQPGAFFGWTGLAGGLGEGLCFALTGFAVGFGLFFVLWLLGTCGGGDVKLFAALGAWLGPLWTLYILLGTYVVVLFGFVIVGWAIHVARKGMKERNKQVAYSFPVALATIVILLWVCRDELGVSQLYRDAVRPTQLGMPAVSGR